MAPSYAAALGLRTAALGDRIPNYGPAFLGFHFIWAYCVLASRTPKQIYGIDHNVSPRYDLKKYGDEAVQSGKITQRQLEQLQRIESASANSVENYILFATAIGFATFSGVDRRWINAIGLTYTVARVVYSAVYVFVDHTYWSQVRGVAWWVGNVSCLSLLWQAGGMLNRA